MWEEKSKKFNSQRKRDRYIESKNLELNSKYWDIYPCEKIAEAEAFELLLRSLNTYPNFKKDYKREYLYILKKYIDSLKQGYKYNKETGKYNIPLRDYLRFINYYVKYEDLNLTVKKSNKSLNLKSRFSIEDRMKFGLPITNEDIKELNKQKIILKKR